VAEFRLLVLVQSEFIIIVVAILWIIFVFSLLIIHLSHLILLLEIFIN